MRICLKHLWCLLDSLKVRRPESPVPSFLLQPFGCTCGWARRGPYAGVFEPLGFGGSFVSESQIDYQRTCGLYLSRKYMIGLARVVCLGVVCWDVVQTPRHGTSLGFEAVEFDVATPKV